MSDPRDWRLYKAKEGGHMIFCALLDTDAPAAKDSQVLAYCPGLNKQSRLTVEALMRSAERMFELSREDKILIDHSYDDTTEGERDEGPATN